MSQQKVKGTCDTCQIKVLPHTHMTLTTKSNCHLSQSVTLLVFNNKKLLKHSVSDYISVSYQMTYAACTLAENRPKLADFLIGRSFLGV